MIKHLFKVSGLDAQGKPFIGSCVSCDIVDAINMFKAKNYSPHEIKQGIQMPAEHLCVIVCLRGAQESFVIARKGMTKPASHSDTPKEFPEHIGKSLRDIIKDTYPRKVGDEYLFGVCGCPNHYKIFSRDYCLCNIPLSNCSDCWDQIYIGYHKED